MEQQQPVPDSAQIAQVELGALSAGSAAQQLQYNAQVLVEDGNGYAGSAPALHAAPVDRQTAPQLADDVTNGSARTMAEQVTP